MVALGEGATGLSQAVGANYHLSSARQSLDHWVNYRGSRVEDEVEFLAANGFNTIRTFLNFDAYEDDTSHFLDDLEHYARTLASQRVLFVAVLFDSFGKEPGGNPELDAESTAWIQNPASETIVEPDFMARAEEYVADVVRTVNQAIADVEDPEVWWIADVWNEPALATVTFSGLAEILETVRAQPGAPSTTVGFASCADNEGMLATLADHTSLTILSGHPYGMFEEVISTQVQQATLIGDAYGGKPIFFSEAGLPGLFQYYGNVLGWLEKTQVGFALWEGFVGNDQFRNVTGIFYPEFIADGMATVRSTTAANALWSLARLRDPSFEPPNIARAKDFTADYVFLGPADVGLSTGAYHAFLRDYSSLYGTPNFPLLDISLPATRALYLRLMGWTFLGLGSCLTLEPLTRGSILQNLSGLNEEYDLGNEATAETALIDLFALASGLMLEHGLGEPDNHAPEVLSAKFDATVNPDGLTFDAHFETVVFDIDNQDLSVRLFVREVEAPTLAELPLVAIPRTTAHTIDVFATPLTFGKSFEFGVLVTDGAGGVDLFVQPVTLP